MKELSLNVLDIAMNSVKANATLINIHITEDDELLTIEIIDNGCGMTAEFLRSVIDPFCTTRTTRKVGLGINIATVAAWQLLVPLGVMGVWTLMSTIRVYIVLVAIAVALIWNYANKRKAVSR